MNYIKHSLECKLQGGIYMGKILMLLAIILGLLAISIGLTIGIVYLICLCFGWIFSLKIALGVWLISFLVGLILSN